MKHPIFLWTAVVSTIAGIHTDWMVELIAATHGTTSLQNIPYVENGHRNQVLDLYLPESPSETPLPLIKEFLVRTLKVTGK
jgi:hypothetical protein